MDVDDAPVAPVDTSAVLVAATEASPAAVQPDGTSATENHAATDASAPSDVQLTLPSTVASAEHESGLSFFRVRSQLQLQQQSTSGPTLASPPAKSEGVSASKDSTPASAASTTATPAVSGRGGRGRGGGRGGRGRGRARKEARLADAADDQWVQCDACAKWRRVPMDVPVDSLTSSEWTCSMATWSEEAAAAGCDAPAETGETEASVETPAVTPSVDVVMKEAAVGARQGSAAGTTTTGAKRGGKKPRKDSSADTVRLPAVAASGGGGGGGGKKKKKEIEWVQCENPGCEKWRKLPPSISAASLPSTWYCHMNYWDPSCASCDAPAEVAEDEEEADAMDEDVRPRSVHAPLALDTLDAGRTGVAIAALSGRSSDDGHSGAETAAFHAAVASTSSARSSSTGVGPAKKKRRGDMALLMEAAAAAASGSGTPGVRGTVNSSTTASPLPASQRALGRASSTGSTSFTAQARVPFVDRRGMVPPPFVHGARDYHTMLLYHPAELWASASAAGGVYADSVEAARAQAVSAGVGMQPTSVGTVKLSYRDLINASWGKAQKSSAHVHDRSLSAWESHLRWCRSSMYTAPATVLSEFGGAAMDVAAPSLERRGVMLDTESVLHATAAHTSSDGLAAAALQAVTERDLLDTRVDAMCVAMAHAAAVLGCAEPLALCRAAALSATRPVLFALLQDAHDLEHASAVAVDVPYACFSDGRAAASLRAWNKGAKPLAQKVQMSVPGVVDLMRADASRWNTLSVVLGDGMTRAAADAVNEALFARTRSQVAAKYDAMRSVDEAALAEMYPDDAADSADAVASRQERELERQTAMDAEMAAAMEECNLQARTVVWSSEPVSSLDRPPYAVLTRHAVIEHVLLLATLYVVVSTTVVHAPQLLAPDVPLRVRHALTQCQSVLAFATARSVAQVLKRMRALLIRSSRGRADAEADAAVVDTLDEAAAHRRLAALARVGLLRRVDGSALGDGADADVRFTFAHDFAFFAAHVDADAALQPPQQEVAMDLDDAGNTANGSHTSRALRGEVTALHQLCSEAVLRRWAGTDRSHASDLHEEHAPPQEDGVLLPLKLGKPWRRAAAQ